MDNQELIQLITHAREERNLEYKGNISWDAPQSRASLIKTILAMSNVRDGGAIVIGVGQHGENFVLTGLSQKNFDTFKQNDISSLVNEFTDPYVEITVRRIDYEHKNYVVIQVEEFSEIPVICKRDGEKGLRRGAIYTRPRRKIESAEIPSQVEMREILDMALEKYIRKFKKQFSRSGLEIIEPEEHHRELFDEQLEGL